MDRCEGQMRQNILTEQWVVYAPQRARRPEAVAVPGALPSENLPEKHAMCPFCPGNERKLTEIAFELEAESGDRWLTRAVPNKYPALSWEGRTKGAGIGPYLATSAFGRHEVIIESPLHNKDIPLMEPEQIVRVLETYVRRHRSFQADSEEILSVIIFRNHGPASGTSLMHPHSQIIGAALIPKYVHDKEAIAAEYFEREGRCSLCDVQAFESSDGHRTIYENASFLGMVPFAAEVPCEVWIIPKEHCPDFGRITESERLHLAEAMKNVLKAYRDRLEDPDYNYVIHSCSRQKADVPYLHWHLQIRPRTAVQAGFEIGSGIHINTSLPEEDAKVLREQIAG